MEIEDRAVSGFAIQAGARSLSARERAVVSGIELELELSAKTVADRIGATAETVSYVTRRLAARGVIQPRCFINSYKLGYMDIAVFFSLSEQSKKARAHLTDRLMAHPDVVYFGTLLGDYQYVAVMLSRSLEEFSETMMEIAADSGDAFAEKIVVPRVSVSRFARKYLNPKLASKKVLLLKPDGPSVAIDETDETLLWILGNEPFESIRSVAARAQLPVATVDRRIKKLRHSGVIRDFYWDLDVAKVAIQGFRVLVQIRGLSCAVRTDVFELCRKHPHVVYLIESLGAWDFEIGVETPDPHLISSVIEELHGATGGRVRDVRVLMELADLLCRMYPGKAGVGASRA